MDRPASQCTSASGCESGWTLYLNQSTTLHQDQQHHHSHGGYRAATVYDHDGEEEDEEEEEEDMSMVSDASSGPPHCHEDHDQDSFNGNGNGSLLYSPSASGLAQSIKMVKKMKSKSMDHRGAIQRHSHLDDTASSPILSFSKKNMNFSNKKPSMEHVSSEGFSATHFKGKSAKQKHFGFYKTEK